MLVLDLINVFVIIEFVIESSLGSIFLDSFIGGILFYVYEWDNGYIGLFLLLFEFGVYSFFVMDVNGCIVSFSFEVLLVSGLNDIFV